ncbi:MAG: tetratricopeptide repeat protein [Alphaproteobacteria bacterium]
MSNIFVEVDEAIKQERLEKIWKDYGGLVVGFIAAIILGTAANAGYKSWKVIQNEKQTSLFFSVIEKPNYTIDDLTAITPDLKQGLQDLTELHAAGKALENGDTAQAMDLYKQVAQGNTKTAFGQMAQYMVATLSDNADITNKLSALDAITSDANHPWRYHAHLDTALIKANITGDIASARTHIKSIIDAEKAPEGLKKKAQSLNIIYRLQDNK